VPINVPTWNVLFWIIMLFVATNSIAKSFIQESKERQLYYYTIANPQSIIISKIMFHSLLLVLFLVMIGFAIYVVLLGNPVNDLGLFMYQPYDRGTGFSASLL
jgi:heme exporter protein B